jgi:hypothetical protein
MTHEEMSLKGGLARKKQLGTKGYKKLSKKGHAARWVKKKQKG